MGVRSVNQHLTVYVSTAAAGVAKTAAALANGEVTYLAVGGPAAGTATPPADKDFRVAYKDTTGNLFLSNTVPAAGIVSMTTQAYGAPVEQKDILGIASAIVGETYIAKLRVPNYGGLISPQDEVFFYGNYTAAAGDDAAAIAAGLAASLKKAVDAAPVPFANITATGTTVVAEGLPQPYVRAKWDGRQVNFDLSLAKPESLAQGSVKDTVPYPGTGVGKQVASMEEFYAGYNEGYKNRFGDYPYDTQPNLAADPAGTYNAQTIVFRTKREGANVASQRQTIVVFYAQ